MALYPITLIPATRSPRENVEATFLVERAPVQAAAVVAAAAVATVPDPTAWPFLDNFDGAGSLSEHISDSGHAYLSYAYGAANPSGLVLVDGELRVDPASASTTLADVVAMLPPSADYFVEAVIRADVALGSTSSVTIGLRGGPDTGGGVSITISPFDNEFDPGSASFNVDGVGFFEPGSLTLSGTTFTVRIEALGSAISMFIDGVPLAYRTTPESPFVFTTDQLDAGAVFVAMTIDVATAAETLLGFVSVTADDL